MTATHHATPEIRTLSSAEIESVSGAAREEAEKRAKEANDAGKFSKGAAKLNLAG